MTYFDVFYERKMKKKKMINKIRECNIEESNHMIVIMPLGLPSIPCKKNLTVTS
jgi:hypothetical protein